MPCAFGVCMKVKQIEIVKLTPAERETAKRTFAMMAEIFGEDCSPLGDGYLEKLLGKDQFWAFAALIGDEVVGGATAHVLPMTRAELQELFHKLLQALAPFPEARAAAAGVLTENPKSG